MTTHYGNDFEAKSVKKYITNVLFNVNINCLLLSDIYRDMKN